MVRQVESIGHFYQSISQIQLYQNYLLVSHNSASLGHIAAEILLKMIDMDTNDNLAYFTQLTFTFKNEFFTFKNIQNNKHQIAQITFEVERFTQTYIYKVKF